MAELQMAEIRNCLDFLLNEIGTKRSEKITNGIKLKQEYFLWKLKQLKLILGLTDSKDHITFQNQIMIHIVKRESKFKLLTDKDYIRKQIKDDVCHAFLAFYMQIKHFYFSYFQLINMNDLSRTHNEFRTTIMSLHPHSNDTSKLRFISPDKWKNLMIKSLAAVSGLSYADKDLVHDLMFIIKNIAEDKFVQAILSFQPFKPKFRPMKFLDLESKKSCMGSTATNEESCFSTPRTKLRKDDSILERGSIIIKRKNSVKKEPRTCQTIKSIQFQQKQSFLKQYLEVIIQEEALKKQFQKKYHPFKKIIDSFVFILENKFKNMVDDATKHISLERIQQLMTNDILLMEKLMLKIAEPYQTMFSSQNPEEVTCFRKKMNAFIKDYVHSNEKINGATRKVMRHYARKSASVLQIQKSISDFVEVTNFNIPEDFEIDGCYVQSMNSLMEFAECTKADQSLVKLKEFRRAIAEDVDHYYESMSQIKEREINAEVQIEIVRFVLCKLKGWVADIFGQLKFLEVVYGDEEIAYKYDDASYIYAQLITVIDALEIQSSEGLAEKSVKSE